MLNDEERRFLIIGGTQGALVILALLTGIYLLAEFNFIWRVINVLGQENATEELLLLEKYGHWLTSSAVALFVMQWTCIRASLMPSLKTHLLAFTLPFIAFAATWVSVKPLLETLVERSTPEFRQAALIGQNVQRSILFGKTAIPEVSIPKEQLDTLSAKVTLAMLPIILATQSPSTLTSLLVDADAQRMDAGNAFNALNEHYEMALLAFEVSQGRTPTSTAYVRRALEQFRAQYREEIKRNGWRIDAIPIQHHYAVRRTMFKAYPHLQENWHPHDVETLARAAVIGHLKERFKAEPVDGHPIEYFKRENVQNQLRVATGMFGAEFHPPYKNLAQFKNEVYGRERSIAALQGERASIYGEGGSQVHKGRDAARTAILPALILCLSLLGALAHVGKLIYVVMTQISLRAMLSVQAPLATSELKSMLRKPRLVASVVLLMYLALICTFVLRHQHKQPANIALVEKAEVPIYAGIPLAFADMATARPKKERRSDRP